MHGILVTSLHGLTVNAYSLIPNFLPGITVVPPPPFNELVIYQLHIGTWYIPEGRHRGRFLDVLAKLPYLKALGINAIQPLPVIESSTMSTIQTGSATIVILANSIVVFAKG